MNILAYVHLRNIYRSTGAGRVARAMTEQLAARNDTDLRVLADERDHRSIVPQVGTPWTGFRYHFMQQETSLQQARWLFLNAPRAESFWPETQIVYCTAESYVPATRARLVVTMHDAAYFEPAAHHRDLSYWKQRCKWRILYSRLIGKADLFHTVSQFSADRLAHFFPSMRSRLRVVHNGVNASYFRPVTNVGEEMLRQQGLHKDPFVLVPGGLHYRKNAELILEAWPLLQDKHPGLKLVVVNHSDPAYIPRALALGEPVRLVGFVEDDLLRSLYGAAQVVWFPSRYEGFGLPAAEAMACGTPVLASDSSSLPEITGGAAVLARPDRAADHVDALDALLESSAWRRELAEKGRERAVQFSWANSAANLRKSLEALI